MFIPKKICQFNTWDRYSLLKPYLGVVWTVKKGDVATLRNWTPPPPAAPKDVEYPERRRLKIQEKVPQFASHIRPPKMFKQIILMRGPEQVHNKLFLKKYGIQAIQGGRLHHGHFEMIRMTIARKMDESRSFAMWRVDPPWQSVTKNGTGHRMGGGKGSISHYVTPIRPGRIIMEIGGHSEYGEVEPYLKRIAKKLPFKAKAVSQQGMEEEEEHMKWLEENNLNPFNFEHCLKNNMLGSRKWASPYDFIWHGKYR